MGSVIEGEWGTCGAGCDDGEYKDGLHGLYNFCFQLGCACPDTLDLVCGMDEKEYPNPCEAECKGTIIECKGPCPCQPSRTCPIFNHKPNIHLLKAHVGVLHLTGTLSVALMISPTSTLARQTVIISRFSAKELAHVKMFLI